MNTFLLVMIGMLLAMPALAADGQTVDLTAIAIYVIGGVFATISSVAGVIIRNHVKDKTMADLLCSAVQNSLGKMQQASEIQINNAAVLHPTLPPDVAVGVQYVADHAQEALDHFGITP